MKKYLLSVIIFLVVGNSFAGIDSYKDLRKALLKGDDVRAVLDLGACQLPEGVQKTKGSNGPRGGFTISSFYLKQLEIDVPVIMALHSHYTLHYDNVPSYAVVALSAHEDSDHVMVRSSVIDAKSYEVKQDFTFKCAYGDGIEFEK